MYHKWIPICRSTSCTKENKMDLRWLVGTLEFPSDSSHRCSDMQSLALKLKLGMFSIFLNVQEYINQKQCFRRPMFIYFFFPCILYICSCIFPSLLVLVKYCWYFGWYTNVNLKVRNGLCDVAYIGLLCLFERRKHRRQRHGRQFLTTKILKWKTNWQKPGQLQQVSRVSFEGFTDVRDLSKKYQTFGGKKYISYVTGLGP
jgi:hypothetical protein